MISAIATTPAAASLDIERIRAQFPATNQTVRGKPLVYLDSAATALKPQVVIDAVTKVYAQDCANIHRAVHVLSQRATAAYEATRGKVKDLLGAASTKEIIFVSGATEGLNLVAQSWARPRLGPGDEVLVSGLEHHSNIVPWQMVCQQTGATLVVAPLDDCGDVPLEAFASRIGARTKIVACAHVSNALGTVLPVAQLAPLVHAVGAVLVVDGAQGVPHVAVDVAQLGCDFYAISGHKLYGPTGTGVLWGKQALLEEMPPWQGGGDMIRSVTFAKTTYAGLPGKFEAGTPNIAGVIGLGAAIDYVLDIGMDELEAHEQSLLTYGTELLSEIPGVRIIGTAPRKVGVLSFVMDDAHPHDIGTIVDGEGVAVRTGHHCAQPVMEHFGIPATARASLGMYNTRADLDALAAAIRQVQKVFAR